MKPVALYLRVSTSKQDTTSQEQELRDYCKRRGWDRVIEFRDVESGSKCSRKALNDMMAMVRTGKLSVVVAAKIDRLARSLPHFCQIVSELRAHGTGLVIPSQQIDSSSDSATGELVMNILATIASFERQLIVSRVNAGLKAARERGQKLGRPNTLSKRESDIKPLLEAGKGIREIARVLEMPPSSVMKIANRLRQPLAA